MKGTITLTLTLKQPMIALIIDSYDAVVPEHIEERHFQSASILPPDIRKSLKVLIPLALVTCILDPEGSTLYANVLSISEKSTR